MAFMVLSLSERSLPMVWQLTDKVEINILYEYFEKGKYLWERK